MLFVYSRSSGSVFHVATEVFLIVCLLIKLVAPSLIRYHLCLNSLARVFPNTSSFRQEKRRPGNEIKEG